MSQLAINQPQQPPFARRHRPDMLLLLFIGILVLLGLIVIYSISPALAARAGSATQDQTAFMLRQVSNLAVGVVAFIATSFIPISFWKRYQGRLLVGALVLGVVPFLLQATPIGLCANGACRWIDLGFTSFQPAELMKFALVIFLAGFLAVRAQQGKVSDKDHTLIPVAIVLVVMAIIVVGLQKDLGTGLTIFGIVIAMLFMAGINAKWLGVVLVVTIGIGVLFTLITPGRIERILTFVNHSSVTPDSMGYHINQALIAIGSGGLAGKGLGQGVQAFGYLPEAANDSIFAIMAEKFGFLGTLAVLAIFAALFMRILAIMEYTADPYNRLVVAGVFGWVFAHTVVNIGAMLGLIPLTGITLPFVSFGGTSLLLIMAALGVVFQISRYTSHTKQTDQQTGGTNDYRERGRGLRRSRHAGTSRIA